MGRNIHLINDKGYTGALDLLDKALQTYIYFGVGQIYIIN